MQIYLKSPTMPENYTLAVLDFISLFYSKAFLCSKFILKDIIENTLALCMKLDKPSEDFKISFSKMISALFKGAEVPDVKRFLYEEDLKLPLSHIIFQLLEWAENDVARSVIFAVLDTLDALVVDPNCSDHEIEKLYVERLTPMLPGTTTKIVKVLKRNFPAQGHKIKSRCLELWSKLVISLINDKNVQLEPSLNTNSLLSDPQWVGNAKDHLFQHMQIFSSMTLHPQVLIRQKLQQLCEKLLKHSWKSLGNTRALQVRKHPTDLLHRFFFVRGLEFQNTYNFLLLKSVVSG